jgi:hypothetical protein
MQCAVQVVRLVGVPLQIAAHPVQKPRFFGANKLHSRYWGVANCRFVLPIWTDLEYVDSLTAYRITDIDLRANVFWWASLLQEPDQRFLIDSALEVVESHVFVLTMWEMRKSPVVTPNV